MHFSALQVPDTIYGTLYTNEYVEFTVTFDANGKLFATEVTGVRRGPLLCQYEPNGQRMRSLNRLNRGQEDEDEEDKGQRQEEAQSENE